MGLKEHRETLQGPLRQATLCFLVKENQILLGMKKRGFGEGLWNGMGGKVKSGESLLNAARRETFEEIGVKPQIFRRVATLDFFFTSNPDFNQQVAVFLVTDWKGKTKESEEMLPRWFSFDQIPYNKMWIDDQLWLPQVLKGRRLKAEFLFSDATELKEHHVSIFTVPKEIKPRQQINIGGLNYRFSDPQMSRGFNLWLKLGMPLPFIYFRMLSGDGKQKMIHATKIAEALEKLESV